MNIGKISENILKRSVLKYLNNKNVNGAAAGADCAVFTGYVANEDSEKCGSHALIRAINNAATEGYTVSSVAISVTMPEQLREIKLKKIAMDIASIAERYGINIVDGHCETVGGIKFPIVNVTAQCKKTSSWVPGKLKPGQAIIMTKWMAMSGTARIANSHREELLTRYPSFIVDDAVALDQFYSILPEAAVAVMSGVSKMNDCSDGGVFAALWQLANEDNVGLEVNLRDIPVRQETIEVCEFFDINPYRLRSDGALLIVTDNPDELIKGLEKENIKGTLIGFITDNRDRVILSGEDRRFLEEPRQDEGVML